MPVPPQCQPLLDQFTADAQTASDSLDASTQADAALVIAQQTADTDKQKALDDHVAALASAQAFIDCMVPPPPTPAQPATK